MTRCPLSLRAHFFDEKSSIISASNAWQLKNVPYRVGRCCTMPPAQMERRMHMTSHPYVFPKASIPASKRIDICSSDVCAARFPRHCVTADYAAVFPGATCAVSIINCESIALSR